jgi:hypothetical protein
MKIIVDIAKTDWPHFYPDFFPQVEQICSISVNTKEIPLRGIYGIFNAFCNMLPPFSSYDLPVPPVHLIGTTMKKVFSPRVVLIPYVNL